MCLQLYHKKTLSEVFSCERCEIYQSCYSLIKENGHNSRTSDDIDTKLGPVNKLYKRNKTTSKKLTMRSCQKIVTSLSFFRFLANFEQSRGQIPETESANVMFSVIVTFCFTKFATELEYL